MPTRSSNVISLPTARPRVETVYQATDADINAAISRAQKNLLRQQKPDGHWCGELFVDSTLCSDYVLYMHWLGEIDPELQERCTQHILKRQLSDGGWNIYFDGPSEINASVKAYFALKLGGYPAELPLLLEPRSKVLRLAGIRCLSGLSRLYLALLVQSHCTSVPPIRLGVI